MEINDSKMELLIMGNGNKIKKVTFVDNKIDQVFMYLKAKYLGVIYMDVDSFNK